MGTWQRRPSGRVPTRFIPVRVARATVTMAVLRICALLLLFDCQEAFHCCLVVAYRINMISIECHRSGERCPGKREFDNRIEINRVRSGEIMWLFPLSSKISSVRLTLSRWRPIKEKWCMPICTICHNFGNNDRNYTKFGAKGTLRPPSSYHTLSLV